MPLVSEFAEFTEALRRRRLRVEDTAPRVLRAVGRELGEQAAAPLLHTSRLLEDAMYDLTAAEEELRAQNEELFRARLDIEASEAHFRQFFDLAPVPYLLSTPDAQLRLVNAAACTLLRRPANGLVGKPLACFVDVDERPAFRTALTRVKAGHGVEEWPIRVVPTGGTPIECRMRVRVLPPSADDLGPSLAWCITEETSTLPGEW
jgi:PAS domain-containing protein